MQFTHELNQFMLRRVGHSLKVDAHPCQFPLLEKLLNTINTVSACRGVIQHGLEHGAVPLAIVEIIDECNDRHVSSLCAHIAQHDVLLLAVIDTHLAACITQVQPLGNERVYVSHIVLEGYPAVVIPVDVEGNPFELTSRSGRKSRQRVFQMLFECFPRSFKSGVTGCCGNSGCQAWRMCPTIFQSESGQTRVD